MEQILLLTNNILRTFTIAVLYLAKSYLDKKGHPKALFYLFLEMKIN